MKQKALSFALLLTIGCFMACGTSKEKTNNEEEEEVVFNRIEGDSTIYGMACDGCNDTIVVYLETPYNGTDPDTLNILEASKQHKIFGHPRIGDKLAIVRNGVDTTKADMVIVTEDLQGNWCYKVLPTLRMRADMEGHTIKQKISQLPDTIVKLLKVEREYGISIKAENVAFPIGMNRQRATSDEESPVEYPKLKFYNEWFIYNGKIVLRSVRPDSLGQQQVLLSDTADLEMLTPDTLVFHFAEGSRGYYRKTEK
ncbi:MAG: hypothetical protein K6D91_08170 [Prevotella sp.]|nr:hypothetical protein [Prevotella sp.]